MQIDFVITLIISTVCGLLTGLIFYKLYNNIFIKKAKEEAQEIIAEAQEQFDLKRLEENEHLQELEVKLWTQVESTLLKQEERIEELTNLVEEKSEFIEGRVRERQSHNDRLRNELREKEKRLENKNLTFQEKLQNKAEISEKIISSITAKLQIDLEELKNKMAQDIVTEADKKSLENIQLYEEEVRTHSESIAKNIIATCIERFARPYISEKGISGVYFQDAQARQNFCEFQTENTKAIQETCGCDIYINNESELLGVAGFDPVRRELTRRVLEKLLADKKTITPSQIKKVAEIEKSKLFQSIKKDGENIARELKIQNLHPEIKQMMGALKYRYSFTQNQYFHCGEVGWLAGLLASELNLNISKARRSGMLHDLGKAMDHAMDGGHAMIGADFIESRGESPEVVYSVRAHHYDVQPNADNDFLVIAADAISGARPGARRSTIETYNQKITALQDIAYSFEGVDDCIVLNGGRECRVSVNSRKYDDTKALELSKNIAQRIETECSYPGQIKVVVVRETQVTESTKKEYA